MRFASLLAAGTVLLASMPGMATAASGTAKTGVEVCARKALAQHPGDIIQAVLKKEKSGLVWELEIQQKDKFVEVECSAENGKIVETETRVESADETAFKSKVKISEEEARKTALGKFAGEVERVEYEIESDGKASYEFDIKTGKGDMRVEVDAASGKIVESSSEILEVGRLK